MKLTHRKRHITDCASRSSRRPQTITPLLETHRHIYRLSGIQANLARLLFERRNDDPAAQSIVTLLTELDHLITYLYMDKDEQRFQANRPKIANGPIGPRPTKIAKRSSR